MEKDNNQSEVLENKLHALCAAYIEACTKELDSSMVETTIRPDLANQHRKELIACAWLDLSAFHRRLMEKS